jgi:Sodium:solute symporter family
MKNFPSRVLTLCVPRIRLPAISFLWPRYSLGYGLISILVVVVATLIGLTEYFYSDKDIASFFVGGRSFSLLVAAIGVAGQMIDPSSTLGNAEWAYKTSFFDGAAVPIGGAISLVLNGLLLASYVNKEQVLTLPDVLARRYGPVVETVVSTFAVVTLLMLIAGNLERCAKIVSYLWNTSLVASLWIVALCIWLITVSGGLVSATSTSVVQGLFCWGGCILTFVYVASQRYPSASPPSIGFPGKTTRLCTFPRNSERKIAHWSLGYIYPDTFGDPICDMYKGVPCSVDPSMCCYNQARWCPNGGPHCDRYDRGAYPFGDKAVYANQMTDPDALSPFPNAILWNWATILVMAFGNLGALDLEARCLAGKNPLRRIPSSAKLTEVWSKSMAHTWRVPCPSPLLLFAAARTPRIARLSFILAGCFVFIVAVPFAYLGSITRYALLPLYHARKFER